VFVDDTAPITTEEIIGPSFYNVSEDKLYVDGVTQINLTCVDPQPHPVNNVVLKYRYRVDEGDGFDDWNEWADYSGPFSFEEESHHELEYYCSDALGNTESIHATTYYVDHTKPVTTKAYGSPEYPEQICQEVSGMNDGCDEDDAAMCPMVACEAEETYPKWITSDTEITLNSYDGSDNHDSGVDYTEYRVRRLVNPNNWYLCEQGCGEWDGKLQYLEMNQPSPWLAYESSFKIDQESCHVIEYYSVDMVNKTEEIKRQCVFVDNSAPNISKIIDGDKIAGEEPIHYYLTSANTIKLDCEDVDPHPVENEILTWEMYWSYDNLSEWELISSGTEETGHKEFTNLNDSYHKFRYKCEDILGNSGDWEEEIDVVDNLAPILTKTIGEPKYNCTEGQDCEVHVTPETNITFTCEDVAPHPVGHEGFCFSVNYDLV